MIDRILSIVISVLALSMFSYAAFLAYENGDVIMVVLTVVTFVVIVVCATRWKWWRP